MTDKTDKSQLASEVVDALYGDLSPKLLNVRDDWPEKLREQIRADFETSRHQQLLLLRELYEKHMSVEQLRALADFHNSTLGKSIKEAQALIQQKMIEAEKQEDNSLASPIASFSCYFPDPEEEQ